ncbi:MAG: hypothetical protein V4808_10190 [Pseudomonadota bacterium]
MDDAVIIDGSNAGFELTDRISFAVHYHSEASLYLFERFVGMLQT